MNEIADEQLVTRYARSGDEPSLEELVKRHWGQAYRISLRALGDPAAAEDAAQESFVSLVRSASRFDPARRFAPWFRALVLNAARMQGRARATRAQHESRAARAESVPSEGEREVARAEVEAELARLDEEVRFPLILHFWEGCTYDEVGEILGCPKTTARSRIERGVGKLREALAGAGCAAGGLEAWLARAGEGRVPTPARPSAAKIAAAAKKVAVATAVGAKLALAVSLAVAGIGAGTIALRVPDPPVAGAPGKTSAPDAPAVAPAGSASAPVSTTTRAAAPALPSGGAVAAAREKDESAATNPSNDLVFRARVLDAKTRAPIAGAEVFANVQSRDPDDPDDRSWWQADDQRTGPDGAFAVATGRAHPDRVTLCVRAAGHQPFLRTFSIEQLSPPPTIVLEPGSAYALAGKVVDKTTRAGVANVSIEIALTDTLGRKTRACGRLDGEERTPDELAHQPRCTTTTRTNADGTFRIDGFFFADAQVDVESGQGFGADHAQTRTAEEPAPLTIEVSRAAELTVEVFDGAGAAASDAHVAIFRGPRDDEQSAPAWSRGKPIAFDDLVPGEYTLKVGYPRDGDPDRAEAARHRIYDAPDVTEKVALAPGEKRKLEVRPPRVAPAEAAETPRTDVAITVRFASGAPGAGVEVWLAGSEAHGWSGCRRATTDETGAARIALAPDTYAIQAFEDPSGETLRKLEVGAAPATLELTIPDRARARGAVRDETGKPVADARVSFYQLSPRGMSRSATTSRDGLFATLPLSVGKVNVSISADGYEELDEVAENDGQPLAFVLRKGRALRARATVGKSIADGTHVDAWLIRADGQRSWTARGAVVGGVADAELDGLPGACAADLYFRVEGFVAIRRRLVGDEKDLDLGTVALDKGGTIRGRIADPDGRLRNRENFTYVSFTPKSCELLSHSDKIAPDGTFVLTGVPLEPITLHVSVAIHKAGQTSWFSCDRELDAAAIRDGDVGTLELAPRKDD